MKELFEPTRDITISGKEYNEIWWALNMAKAAFDRIANSKRKWTGADQDAYEAVESVLNGSAKP